MTNGPFLWLFLFMMRFHMFLQIIDNQKCHIWNICGFFLHALIPYVSSRQMSVDKFIKKSIISDAQNLSSSWINYHSLVLFDFKSNPSSFFCQNWVQIELILVLFSYLSSSQIDHSSLVSFEFKLNWSSFSCLHCNHFSHPWVHRSWIRNTLFGFWSPDSDEFCQHLSHEILCFQMRNSFHTGTILKITLTPKSSVSGWFCGTCLVVSAEHL